MALPNHEDLMRLKSFIEFVTENPKILNFPQLDFVKKFIEHFGGKVPEGEFKMPGGGKCPFGGDAKSESKPSEAEKSSEPEDEEMESDVESEVELDMEVGSCHVHDENETLDDINAIFLKETKDNSRKSQGRKGHKAKTKKELISEDEDEGEDEITVCNMDDDHYGQHEMWGASLLEEDPIHTAEVDVVIKSEFDFNDVEDDENVYKKTRTKRKCARKKESKKQVLGGSVSRTRAGRKYNEDVRVSSYEPKKVKLPKPIACSEKCKHNCANNFKKERRKELCTEFWSLDFVGRKNYLLKWVESRKVCTIRKIKRTTRGYTNRYFLKGTDGEKQRVCLGFFLSTLCVSVYMVKNAFDGSDGKGHYVGYDKRAHRLEPPLSTAASEFEENENENKDKTKDNAGVKVSEPLPADNAKSPVQNTNTPFEVCPELLTPLKQRKCRSRDRTQKKDKTPQSFTCGENCMWKCSKNFTEEQRAQICATFWTMDYKRRKDFVLSRIESREVECITATEYRKSSRAVRSCSNRYYFRGARGENVRVCSKFFTKTLCIGTQIIRDALKNADSQTGAYIGEDKRGRHVPGNKIPNECLLQVKRHIESYPTWIPHKNHKTRFLHSSLNITRMYNEYKKVCVKEHQKFVGKGYFSDVFHKQYRLAFLKPTSKHDHKVSAVKREIDVPVTMPPKKINTNISDYTGDEGGFWLRPHSNTNTNTSTLTREISVDHNLYVGPARNEMTPMQMKEQVSVPAAPVTHTYPAGSAVMVGYSQQTTQEQVPQSRDVQVTMSNFSHPPYEYSSVFRML